MKQILNKLSAFTILAIQRACTRRFLATMSFTMDLKKISCYAS